MATDTDLRAAVDAEHRKQEFEQEAGQAVTPAPMPDHTEPQQAPDDLRVDGTVQLGLFETGGKHATSSTLRLTGGKIDLVDGRAFKKGDTVKLEVVAVVGFIGQQDKVDAQTGQVVSCEQQHK